MTIQGARNELINMMECKDLPFYFVPILQKVVETIEMEFATVCDIEQIRAEIEQTADNYNPMRDAFDGGYVMAIKDVLQIIDKYKGDKE